jgi:predicted NBD/HSP70 family sugar kinase
MPTYCNAKGICCIAIGLPVQEARAIREEKAGRSMPFIARSDDLRRQNQRRILSALREKGPMSRSELSAATGLSASTVTLITANLFERGALREDHAETASAGSDREVRRGRPKVALVLDGDAAAVGVVLLTFNKISAAVFDYAGLRLSVAEIRIESATTSRNQLRSLLVGTLEEAMRRSNLLVETLRTVSIAVQGVTDGASQVMLWSPMSPLADVPLADWFADHFGARVLVSNDCNMIANALKVIDPDRYGDSFAAILLSHGIGMGLYLKGGVFTGLKSSAAEFGHMCFEFNGAKCRCGRRGCVEAYAGDYAIWRAATGGDPQQVPLIDFDLSTMRDLALRAEAHDGPERAAYRRAGQAIGAGLRSLFSLLDPFPVAFAGPGALAFHLMEPAIREAIGAGAAGVPRWSIDMRCYPDENRLIEMGALYLALSDLDNTIFALPETQEKELQDVG